MSPPMNWCRSPSGKDPPFTRREQPARDSRSHGGMASMRGPDWRNDAMRSTHHPDAWLGLAWLLACGFGATWPDPAMAQKGGSPDDDLPPHITRLTDFGERADFSHDGRKLLF